MTLNQMTVWVHKLKRNLSDCTKYISLDSFYAMLQVCQQYTWMTWKLNLVSTSMEKQILQYTALNVPVYTKYSSYVEVFYQKIQFVPRDYTVLKKPQRLYLIKVFLKLFISMTLNQMTVSVHQLKRNLQDSTKYMTNLTSSKYLPR